MQCDETCSTYSPCVPTCPSETCDNFLNLKNITEMCKQDTCVEGNGQVLIYYKFHHYFQ